MTDIVTLLAFLAIFLTCLLLNPLHIFLYIIPYLFLSERKRWPEVYQCLLSARETLCESVNKDCVSEREKQRREGTIVGYSWHCYPGLSDRNCTDSRVCMLWLMERMSECDRTGDQPRDTLSDDTFSSCLARHSFLFFHKSTPVTCHAFWSLKAWFPIDLHGNVTVWKKQHVHSLNFVLFFSIKGGKSSSVKSPKVYKKYKNKLCNLFGNIGTLCRPQRVAGRDG